MDQTRKFNMNEPKTVIAVKGNKKSQAGKTAGIVAGGAVGAAAVAGAAAYAASAEDPEEVVAEETQDQENVAQPRQEDASPAPKAASHHHDAPAHEAAPVEPAPAEAEPVEAEPEVVETEDGEPVEVAPEGMPEEEIEVEPFDADDIEVEDIDVDAIPYSEDAAEMTDEEGTIIEDVHYGDEAVDEVYTLNGETFEITGDDDFIVIDLNGDDLADGVIGPDGDMEYIEIDPVTADADVDTNVDDPAGDSFDSYTAPDEDFSDMM